MFRLRRLESFAALGTATGRRRQLLSCFGADLFGRQARAPGDPRAGFHLFPAGICHSAPRL